MRWRTSLTSTRRIKKVMIQVCVGSGDDVERFIARKSLATRHSDVIRKAFAGGWKEAKENIIRFPEESPEAFQVFVTFLDTGVIHLCHFKGNKLSAAHELEDSRSIDEQWNKILTGLAPGRTPLQHFLQRRSCRHNDPHPANHRGDSKDDVSEDYHGKRRQIRHARPSCRYRGVPPVRCRPGRPARR